jgi:hypothetical protein
MYRQTINKSACNEQLMKDAQDASLLGKNKSEQAKAAKIASHV